jgi:hypothetical protein
MPDRPTRTNSGTRREWLRVRDDFTGFERRSMWTKAVPNPARNTTAAIT